MKTLKHASFFTGIGVFDLAANEAGFENIFQCEINDWCLGLLHERFPGVKKYNDIRTFKGNEYKNTIDIVSGGFPCQDISPSGKGSGIYGSKSSLWNELGRTISEILPRYVLIENSPHLTTKGFEKVLFDLSEIGYDAEWCNFFASEFGKFHYRERLYILAYSNALGGGEILHSVKRSLFDRNESTTLMDSSSNPFLRFEERYSEPSVFGMANGLTKRLDVKNRLSGCGNAVVKDIPLAIFNEIKRTERLDHVI